MKVEYINPIIDAVIAVGRNFFSNDIERGEPFIKSTSQHFDNLIINIGITGDLKGQCILSFTDETIKEVAGAMMGGMKIDKIDEMVKSAISEFSNIIMGNAATNFAKLNKQINISSPITIQGNMDISSELKFLGLPFWINKDNNFDIFFAAKED